MAEYSFLDDPNQQEACDLIERKHRELRRRLFWATVRQTIYALGLCGAVAYLVWSYSTR